MNVRAGKGLKFWCQGKQITHDTVISVQETHDVKCKIADGSLIKVVDKKSNKGELL